MYLVSNMYNWTQIATQRQWALSVVFVQDTAKCQYIHCTGLKVALLCIGYTVLKFRILKGTCIGFLLKLIPYHYKPYSHVCLLSVLIYL